MRKTRQKQKIEFGDFQTPIELTEIITKKLFYLGVKPDIVIEPSCGIGNFLLSASKNFKSTKKLFGLEINPMYLEQINNNKAIHNNKNIEVRQGDFFDFDFSCLERYSNSKVLVIGNFPWVTNSQQGTIKGINLPQKNNFQNHKGLDALTGKSNFDISEWMLIQTIEYLQAYNSYIAMICKTSVARKILNYMHHNNLKLSYSATYGIDTKKYFQANVESCLLFCEFSHNKKQYFCDVFPNIDSTNYHTIGYYDRTLVRDIETFNQVSSFFIKQSSIKWRSGIKHDCSKVMELSLSNNKLINGFSEFVDIEDTYLYPLLKGSDIANGRTNYTRKYVLVPQKSIGETTNNIKNIAPKTWNYLSSYAQYLDNRKSKIYHNKPRFSVFGVGNYSFKPWKIAICGLYKKLNFQLINQINSKPTFFDDTVYFIGFDNEKEAKIYFNLLNSEAIFNFYSSLIFWDEKRPIKASILNKLDIEKAEYELNNFKKFN